MPCAFSAAAKPSRSMPSGSRMVYCAHTEVEPPALIAGAKSLRGVVKNEHAFGFRDRTDAVMVGALPEQIDGNHRRRFEAESDRGRDAALQRIQVHVEGRGIDIDEHRR